MTDTYKERATMAETIIATTELESLKLTEWSDVENYGEDFCTAFNAGVSACIAARPSPGWRPIESAPKDGTRILAWRPELGEPYIVRWAVDEPFGDVETWTTDSEGPGYSSELADVTHWMPLPPSPESKP
jgi:hypothetical protein